MYLLTRCSTAYPVHSRHWDTHLAPQYIVMTATGISENYFAEVQHADR